MSKIIVELQEFMGSDLSIANAAWSSTYDKARREEKYDDETKIAELLPRIIKEGHGTPVESVVMRFWIRMPIFCDRQHMTHRIASHNGLSGRYRTMPDDWYSLPKDVINIIDKALSPGYGIDWKERYDEVCMAANIQYKFQLQSLKEAMKNQKITNPEFKRVREVLRGQLPQSGMVERTTIMNLRSFANYQKLRNSDHAQPEIRLVAELMLDEVKKANIAPLAIKLLEEVNWII